MIHRKDAIVGSIVLLSALVLNASAASAAKRTAAAAAKRPVPARTVRTAPAGCPGATVLAAPDDARAGAVDAILCLVNQERTTRGLAAVRLSQQLSQSAAAHSADMVQNKFFSHASSDGMSFRPRVARSGYVRTRSYIAETLAWGTDEFATPLELVRSLMASPSHKAAILDGRFRDVGIGLVGAVPAEAVAADGATLTLQFGRR